MNLTLQRLKESASGPTFGQIVDDADGSIIVAATLELPWRGNQHNVSRIPAGTYPALRFNSPHIGYWLYQLANVPDRVGVDIHIGNSAADTEGCILVGLNRGADGLTIEHSRTAFADLMAHCTGLDRFTLTVVDPSPTE